MVDIANEYKDDPLMQRVALGIDAQYFMTQDKLGIYLCSMAEQQRADALEELALVDPEDAKKIRHFQNQAQISDLFLQWLNAAIAEWRAAEETIKIEEQNAQDF